MKTNKTKKELKLNVNTTFTELYLLHIQNIPFEISQMV